VSRSWKQFEPRKRKFLLHGEAAAGWNHDVVAALTKKNRDLDFRKPVITAVRPIVPVSAQFDCQVSLTASQVSTRGRTVVKDQRMPH
jgi:hypothetical protein